jgi:hypothetical protein
MSEEPVIATTLSFSGADVDALAERVRSLKKTGVTARPIAVLRALIYLTPENELIARCVRLAASMALGGRSEAPTEERPTVHLLRSQMRKLDGVVAQLGRANIISTRSFVVRALLAEAPTGRDLVALHERFREEFPFKPRGLSKLRLEKRARGGS